MSLQRCSISRNYVVQMPVYIYIYIYPLPPAEHMPLLQSRPAIPPIANLPLTNPFATLVYQVAAIRQSMTIRGPFRLWLKSPTSALGAPSAPVSRGHSPRGNLQNIVNCSVSVIGAAVNTTVVHGSRAFGCSNGCHGISRTTDNRA